MLHVLEALEGGTARHVTDVVTHARGVHHVVAIPRERVGGVTDRGAREAMVVAGARVVDVEMRRSPMSVRNAAALVALRRLVTGLRPDIVHGHSSVGGALGRVAGTGRAVRFYTPNGFNPALSMRLAERALAPLTDVLVAVSESESVALRRARLDRSARLVTISNGIDLAPPAPGPDLRAMLGLPAGTPLIGTISRLVSQKAPERFVEIGAACLRSRPDAHLVLIGSGPLQPALDRRVDDLDVRSSFHQVRELPRASAVLDQLDVFVLASRFEGGAYTPLEAMRAGTPVVLSDVVGNRDVVEPGVSGILAAPDDTEAMAGACARLLSDSAFRGAIVAAARARLARFDVVAMGSALSALYLQTTRVR